MGFLDLSTKGPYCRDCIKKYPELKGEIQEQNTYIKDVTDDISSGKLLDATDEQLREGIGYQMQKAHKEEYRTGLLSGLTRLSGDPTAVATVHLLHTIVEQNKVIILQNELNRRQKVALVSG